MKNGHLQQLYKIFYLNSVKHVILAQTDTTVGFLSQDDKKLQYIKGRESSKPFITIYQNLKSLKENKLRVPNSKKPSIRRAKKTTFIVNGVSFRISTYVQNSHYLRMLNWSYSTSANESNKNFNRKFCEENADIIIENKIHLHENNASKIYKINNTSIKRLR